jgi:hypothetical protein
VLSERGKIKSTREAGEMQERGKRDARERPERDVQCVVVVVVKAAPRRVLQECYKGVTKVLQGCCEEVLFVAVVVMMARGRQERGKRETRKRQERNVRCVAMVVVMGEPRTRVL